VARKQDPDVRLQESRGASHASRGFVVTCASLLVDLDVHPVIMAILRHAQITVTMRIYAQVSSRKTVDALRRLGRVSMSDLLLRSAAVRVCERPTPTLGRGPLTWSGAEEI
jgi:hypothetical protein